MSERGTLNLGRRTFLGGLGLGAGMLIAHDGLPPWVAGSSIDDLSYLETLSLLDASLTSYQRNLTVLPWSDPSRQVTNTIAIHRSPHIGTMFDHYQVSLIRQLYKTMLSSQGQQWFHNTTSLEGKFEGSSLHLYSDAAAGTLASSDKTVAMINGGHYMLRHTEGLSRANNYVFGGPISYGQQLGNHVFKVQGNAFKAHGDAVNQFHSALTGIERRRAYKLSPPMELVTQVQGANGVFAGLRIGDASEHAQKLAKEMLATIFSAYPASQQNDAFSAIDENGGVESLHVSLYRDFSFYQDGKRLVDASPNDMASRDDPYTQVWRIEGPACVIHFQGYPHVHAYINVVRDPNKVAIGDVLTETSASFEGDRVIDLLLSALRFETDERYAYYPMPPAGRLPSGMVSTGSVYALDPFDNHAVVIEVAEATMPSKLKVSLARQGAKLVAGQPVRFATASYMLEDSREVGEIDRVVSTGAPIRESLIGLIRRDQGMLRG